MKPRDLADLLVLAALWGASFLFMRLAAAEFGAVALAAVRVAVAGLVLLPLLLSRHLLPALRVHWKPIVVVGLLNSALPFLAYSYAAISLSSGLLSIFNATTPLWGALIAWLWLRDRLTGSRVLGLAIGFAGVLWLSWRNVNQSGGFRPGGTGWAVVATMAATFLYGLSASFTKRHLDGVPPLALATGSQLAASALLAVPAVLWWPAATPTSGAWVAAIALGVLCTGAAYILFFRLIANAGPSNAIAVTFLIPVFGLLWGWVFLAERIDAVMVVGCAIIVVGTALATGLLSWPRRVAAGAR
jgi:drug/metabolite transporter (DMT)-like permease